MMDIAAAGKCAVNGAETDVTATVTFTADPLVPPQSETSTGTGTALVSAGDAVTVRVKLSDALTIVGDLTAGIAFSFTASETV